MKKSRYNFMIPLQGQYVLYNAMTENLSILDTQVAELYCNNDIETIREKHPTFCEYLIENRFVVPQETDEYTELLENLKKEDSNPFIFSLAVNPTLNCNMRCWYCYENHSGNLMMKETVLNSIKRLIDNRISIEGFRNFHLAFFGGEPLLNFDTVAKPLIEYLNEKVIGHEIKISTSFVTNGFLITPDILDFLNQFGHGTHFQITIDGNCELHDAVRKTTVGDSSYWRILKNVVKILSYPDMSVTLRCNFTGINLASFQDVASDVEELLTNAKVDSSRLSFDFHQVWQDKGNATSETDLDDILPIIKSVFTDLGLNVHVNRHASRYRCYADKHTHALVNYNGDIYRCTARDFKPENREGHLNEDGTITWNQLSQKRDSVLHNNQTCASCNIYPLCCGVCSQSKLESGRTLGCDFNYSTTDKQELVRERICWLINNSK
ncbi:MAG: radical SAM protein [Bacteroides sp.]|nr:radical SAM protein [Bacteroides sp.]